MKFYLFLLSFSTLVAQDMDVLANRLQTLRRQFTTLRQTADQLGIVQAVNLQGAVAVPRPVPTPTVSAPKPTIVKGERVPLQKEELPEEVEITPQMPKPSILVNPATPIPSLKTVTEELPAQRTEGTIVGTLPEKKEVTGLTPTLPPPAPASVIEGSSLPLITSYKVAKVAGANPQLLQQEAKRSVFDPFKYVMGITEKEFQKKSLIEQLKYEQMSREGIRVGDPNAPGFFAGRFKEFSIAQLRNLYNQKHDGKGCKFFVMEAVDRPYDDGTGKPNWFLPIFDVGAQQANPDLRDAVFQVASNFNGLEGGGSPAAGIMPYLTERLYVQGEAAAVSAMPGLIYRMYFVGHTVHSDRYVGQLNAQLNFLREIPAITIVDGYPQHVALAAFQNLSPQAYDALVQKVHIGFHEGIQVTSGLGALRGKGELLGDTGFKAVKIDDDNQRISQVLTAAFNLAGTTDTQYQTIARILLDAAYEGTLKAAYENDKKKVYLTLVGGGVFKNDPAWIVDAIIKALDDFVAKGDMEITLIIYAFPGDQIKAESLRKKLLSYATAMKGSYLQYKTDGIYRLEPTK